MDTTPIITSGYRDVILHTDWIDVVNAKDDGSVTVDSFTLEVTRRFISGHGHTDQFVARVLFESEYRPEISKVIHPDLSMAIAMGTDALNDVVASW